MIRNIVFDMGQVLIYFNRNVFFERMGVPAEDWEQLDRELFRGIEWSQLDRGVITEEEAEKAVCSRLPRRFHGYVHDMVFDWWKPPLHTVKGMGELVRELKEQGYGIYLLSNASFRLHEYFHRIPGSECFDGKIVSADWKLLKPDPALYRVLYQEYGLQPEKCLFIDDQPANVEAARYTGMKGLIFRNDAGLLRRELAAQGVHITQ